MPLDVDVATLQLPAALQQQLDSWSGLFMSQEPMWEWDSRADRLRFRTEGLRLAADLQDCLSDQYDVYVMDRLSPRDGWFARPRR